MSAVLRGPACGPPKRQKDRCSPRFDAGLSVRRRGTECYRPLQTLGPEVHRRLMLYFVLKATISGLLIAAVSTLAKRYPGFGALVASLPLVSVLGMMWLWRDRPDAENMAAHAGATFWYVLPSLPMFLLIPVLLRHGVSFWIALAAGCALTITLYLAMILIAPRFGLQL
ncbi:hypothetical protein D3C77_278840 [compost metagenome]